MMQGRTVSRRRGALRVDLSILTLIGLLLFAAIGAGGAALYQQFYSPTAFVERYLGLLSSGRAADALRTPGVAVDLSLLENSGIEPTASEALLRTAALTTLTDYEVTSEKQEDGTYRVAVDYTAGGVEGSSTFSVERNGWIGVVPDWRFAQSPLAEIELTVRGSDTFAVNGFALDRRQVSSHGADAAPLDPLHLLVFTPGLYSVTVDTAISATPGVSVLADTAMARTPVHVQALPTEKFTEVVQERVDEFLAQCAEQQVLLPTACPFGLEVQNRLAPDSLPKWSIATQPKVTIQPDGANWAIPAVDAVAHIEAKIQSLFDGSVRDFSEDVPFQVNGTITILADGSASIRVGSPDADDD
ncbi:hypothetical protein FM104_01260 [Microbacterium esteraromaticum]|uniref:Uncharacterized protein n=1 Tax=Microbacterium esteraromaticum TaxID=57043 RepID=A0A1R4IBI4_9MICO|nr:hypothetical protein [Microbacterium esteraromaticum]SJN17150.1 hypothetical protein FM104_01260 [Microbacterium esteraromaticum]